MNDSTQPDFSLDDDAESMLAAFRAEEQMPADLDERLWARVESDIDDDDTVVAGPWIRRGVIGLAAAAAAVALLWISADALQAIPDGAAGVQAAHEAQLDPHEGHIEGARGGTARPRKAGGVATPVAPSDGPDVESPSSRDPDAVPVPQHEDEGAPATTPDTTSKPPAATEGRGTVRPRPRKATPEPTPAPDGDGSATTANEPVDDAPTAQRPAVEPSTLGQELAMIERARKALLRHEPNLAATILREHQSTFPRGAMAQERRALLAIATCEGMGKDAGKKRANSFLRDHASSALADRVRAACDVD